MTLESFCPLRVPQSGGRNVDVISASTYAIIVTLSFADHGIVYCLSSQVSMELFSLVPFFYYFAPRVLA